MRITDNEFIADFSSNPPAVKAPINTTYPATIATVRIVYMAVLNPHLTYNNGLVRSLKVIAPKGSVFNAEKLHRSRSIGRH